MASEASLGAERALGAIVLASRDHGLLAVVGNVVANIVKRRLSHAGGGATYMRGSVSHQASSPGSPPAVDTGRLRNSIDFQVGSEPGGGYVDVGSSVEYAPYLEYGTSRMAARPFMRPSIAEARPLIERLVAERISIAQREAIRSLPREIILPEA